MIRKFSKNPRQENIDVAINELLNDNNNAVAHVYKNCKVQTQGILKGVPITIKNLFATKDAITDSSCKLLHNFLPGYDAHIVKLLKASGASIVGKTHLDELALGGTGLYSSHGIIKNPLNNMHIVGGSSSGCAATFTKNIGASIGSDTGDSIRMPASYIGVVGFKPSYGVISRRGMFPYASSLDTVGYLTHNVYDSAIISSVLFNQDKKDFSCRKINFSLQNIKIKKPKKITYILTDDLEKYVQKSMDSLIKKLKNKNIDCEIIEIDKKIMHALPIVYKIISFSEAASNNSNLSGLLFGNSIEGKSWSDTMIETREAGFGNIAKTRMILGSLFLKKENQKIFLDKAQKVRTVITKLFNKILNNTDILIFPTSSGVAPLIKEDLYKIDNVIKTKHSISSLLLLSNFIGSPSISIPLGMHNNLPYGLNVNSKIYDDENLLSFSMYLEKLIGEYNE